MRDDNLSLDLGAEIIQTLCSICNSPIDIKDKYTMFSDYYYGNKKKRLYFHLDCYNKELCYGVFKR